MPLQNVSNEPGEKLSGPQPLEQWSGLNEWLPFEFLTVLISEIAVFTGVIIAERSKRSLASLAKPRNLQQGHYLFHKALESLTVGIARGLVVPNVPQAQTLGLDTEKIFKIFYKAIQEAELFLRQVSHKIIEIDDLLGQLRGCRHV